MQSKKRILTAPEFYRILDEVIPGGDYEQAKNDPVRRIYLTRISMDGLKEMHAYSTDERLYEYLEYDPFTTIDDTRCYLQKLIDIEGNEPVGRTAISWFVRRIEDKRLVGTARFGNIEFDRQSVEWGYGIDPKLWGEGDILEIQQILKQYVFETLKINRLWGGTRIDNEPTKASVLAAGGKEEGVLRQALRDSKGNYHDVWRYSMLAEEYFANNLIEQRTSIEKSFTREMIAEIIARVLEIPNNIKTSDDMHSIAKWDSLNHIKIILNIEKETKYKFSPIEISQAISIDEIHKFLCAKNYKIKR